MVIQNYSQVTEMNLKQQANNSDVWYFIATYNNCSSCYKHIGKYCGTTSYCTIVRSINGTHVKSFIVRGQVYLGIQ